jgi:pilus assembly protein CpaB
LRTRAVAVAAAVGVLVTVVARVDAADRSRRRWGETSSVLVAVRDLPAGTTLGPGDVAPVDWPVAHSPDGALEDLPADRRLTTDVVRGEVLLGQRLGRAGEGAWSSLLGDGETAVQLPLREPTPGVAVGDHVDVMAPVAATIPDVVAELSVEVVAHDARVLDVRDDAVTVAVRRAEAVATAGAALGGLVSLVVRP